MQAQLGIDEQFQRYLWDRPSISYVDRNRSWLRRSLHAGLERACGGGEVEALYQALRQDCAEPIEFFSTALQRTRVKVDTLGVPMDIAVPSSGPVIFIANHPFGILDGLILCHFASQLRGDFRIVINAALCRDRALAPFFLPIDFNAGKEAQATNIRTKQLALAALQQGLPLLIFPAGGVATRSHLGVGPVRDLPWSPFAAKLALKAQAPVVPFFFHGSNRLSFHIGSYLAEPVRLACLLAELRRRFDSRVQVTVGPRIESATLCAQGDRRQQSAFLQRATWALHTLS